MVQAEWVYLSLPHLVDRLFGYAVRTERTVGTVVASENWLGGELELPRDGEGARRRTSGPWGAGGPCSGGTAWGPET